MAASMTIVPLGPTPKVSYTESKVERGPPVSASAEKTKILIVDDLPEKFLVFESILEDLGQTLVYASSGADALKLVLRDEFAVILLDVNMPGMDGFEAASLIRSRRRSASTPIIFLTAWADEMRVAQGYASGAVDYIPTPVVPEILRAKVRVFVELFQMRQQAALQAEEHVKKLVAEEAARRFAFLAGAGDRLNRSLDFDTTLEAFSEIAIPFLADLSAVRLEGDMASSAVAWQDADGRRHSRRDERLAWIDDAPTTPDALAPLQPSSAPMPVERDLCIEGAPDLTGASLLVLPVATRGRSFGVVAFVRGSDRQAFQEGDVALAQDIANRGAAALENALLVQTIRDADRRKDEFLATLAHELRNPLAPVRNAVEILNRLDLRDPHLERCRTIIDRQVRQLTRLVDDLLDVSRINSGKIELRRERVDAASVVERAVEISRTSIEGAGHALQLTLPPIPVFLDVDPVRIAQVVANLLNNAAKYTAPGGRIEVAVERNGIDAAITVRDNGMGIPSQMLGAIFDMFTQVENSLDRSQGGLGVGLSLTRRLVELHGGSVSAHSGGPGQGSEFVVRLPLAAAPARAEPGSNAAEPRAIAEGLRVLVVDDNVDSAESLGLLLRQQGHQVQVAFDGPSALAAAAATPPQVVFLDIGMPKMNGYEVAARMRDMESMHDALLVALTGWGQDEDRRRTAQAGFHFHCTKPISMDELSSVLGLGCFARQTAE
jgi:signal transduction histidine kinase